MKTRAERFWSKVDIQGDDDCWLWLGAKLAKGYGVFWFDNEYRYKHTAWAAIAITTNTRPVGFGLHHCDNPPCCNPRHIYIGTDKDNRKDCVTRNRHNLPRGEQNNQAKLTAKMVTNIRRRYSQGETQAALAMRYKVSQTTISFIVNRRIWRHLEERIMIG